ncbi:MAG: DUF4412 domain-containing protein [Arenicellales bacterium]|nr:DUF4412 domain-containing protein [Arenicellales bacterium]
MHNRILTLAFGIMMFWFIPGQAATTINFMLKQVDHAEDVAQAAYIDNGKLLIKAAGGDPNFDLLFQQANETMTIIDHSEKTTLDVDAVKVETLANQAEGMMDVIRQQVASQMENLSEEQQQQVQQMIENMGVGQLMKEPAPPVQPKTFKDVGMQKINGYSCQKMEVYQGNDKVSEICTAQPADMGIPAEDYAVIQAMQAMSQKLRDKTAKISAQMGQNVPQFGDTDAPGVPVQMTDKAGNSMTITQVQNGIGDVNLNKPVGYTPKQMPSLPQLTQ